MGRVDPHWIRGPVDELAIEQGCTFDEARGRLPCLFIERFCRQSKGKKWSGQPIELLDWQRDFLMRFFGWRRADGTRRYRRFYIEIAKKNGKTTLLAALQLFLLIADDDGPEIYINACDRSQASMMFEESARMVRQSPDLACRLEVIESRKTIAYRARNGTIRANSAEAPSKDGLNPLAALFDELHRQPNRDLWEVFEYAGEARDEPIVGSITTAGEAEEGVWFEQREYSEKVNRGEIPDSTHLGIVYRADPADDLDDPATWRKANPSLGVTITEEDFARKLDEAKRVPIKLANFKRLRLNIVVRAEGKFLAPGQWAACRVPPRTPDFFRGRPVHAGLDLSSINDLTALAWLTGDPLEGLDLGIRFWLPAGNIVDLEHEHGVPYRAWADQGHIILTDGQVIDYEFIREELLKLAGLCDLRKVLCDPHNATQIVTKLREHDGLPVDFIRQGFLSLNAPTKELLRLVIARKVRHDGNPVLNWMAGNAIAENDAAGNIKLSKRKSKKKIDGLAALVNGLAAYLTEDVAGPSRYETEDLLILGG